MFWKATLLVTRSFLTLSRSRRCTLQFRYFTSSAPSSLIRLAQRSLLSIESQTGNEDVCGFLQGLVTNDMSHLRTQGALYALMLDRRGRVLYDLIAYNPNPSPQSGEDPETVYLECDASIRGDLLKSLKAYRLRKKIKIDKIDDIFVFADASSNLPATSSSDSFETSQRLVVSDPRTALLGQRVLLSQGIDATVDPRVLTCYRFSLGIPEGVLDLPPGSCFPLESNGDYLNGISFHKGCYVGQELTARTHYTGVVRKRLMPITWDSDVVLEPGTKLRDAGTKKLVGRVRSSLGNLGLGLMRVEEALAAEVVEASVDDGDDTRLVEVRTEKPAWWSDLSIKGFQPEE